MCWLLHVPVTVNASISGAVCGLLVFGAAKALLLSVGYLTYKQDGL